MSPISSITRKPSAAARLLMPAASGIVLLGWLSPGATAAPKRQCNHLRGANQVHSTTIRVVSRHVNRIFHGGNTHIVGTDYLACVLPHGGVRKIGSRYSEYLYPGSTNPKRADAIDSSFVTFGQSAGDFLLVRTRAANLTGDYFEQSRKVVNVRTGASYSYFHSLQGDPPEPAPPEILKLDPQGRLAGIFANVGTADDFSSPPAGKAQVIGFSANGTPHVLDTGAIAAIPAASLTFSSGIAGWTNAGAAKTASF